MEDIIYEWWSELLRERKCNKTSKTAKIVNNSSLEVQENVCELISNYIKHGISDASRSLYFTKKHDLCNAINGCFDNFIHASDAVNRVFSEVINFIDTCIDECGDGLLTKDSLPGLMFKMLDFLHITSRILVLVLKLRRPFKFEKNRYLVSEITRSDKEMLCALSYKISGFFRVQDISMDTKCTLAMGALLIREIILKKKEKILQYHENFLKCMPIKIDEKEHELNTLKFLVANAVVNTWSNVVLDPSSTETYIKFFIQLCESSSSDTGIIMNICKTLILLIKTECFKDFMLNLKSEDSDIVNSLLSCVYMLLDHPVSCVRHCAKDFLRLLSPFEGFRLSMLKSLSTLSIDKRCYFICIAAIANEAGSQCLFDVDQSLQDNLIQALRDPILVTYVITALENVIMKDSLVEEDFSEWCERWIVSLLVSLTNAHFTASADIEKLLKTLFIQYPLAVFYVVDKWSKPKDDELRYIIAALKIYHKHGLKTGENFKVNIESSSDLQENKWKDLISEKLLRFGLHHNNDEIRLSSLSLIIECLKTSERYSEQDFSLIQYSLKCNLNNQNPATRQTFLSLVRKMLVRYSDSLSALKRNHRSHPDSEDLNGNLMNYHRFHQWFIDFCFSNIFDGANFYRLNAVLSLLSTYFELLYDEIDHSAVSDYWKKFLVPLRSSYEENKTMAVALIQGLSILKLYNDKEAVKFVFKRAYELCGKMEPPNVLTGAYLLQTLLDYPRIHEIVREYFSEDMSGINAELLFILLLTRKLEEQTHYAEQNLLQAAISGPMYGTLFAIRIILEDVNFSEFGRIKKYEPGAKLKQTWRILIKKLVELSFRMIRVVSCVVNSSSPEGHLPSDVQSDVELLMNRDDSLQEVVENDDENRVEETLNEITSGIPNINLDNTRPARRSEDIINDCQQFVRRYNKVFLSHGESLSFSQKNAVEFKNLLVTCTGLTSEIENIHRNKEINGCESNQEIEFLTCLNSMESELKRCIAIYEENKCKTDKPTAQILLLCSWRSIKEACLFLGDLILKQPLEKLLHWKLLDEEMVINIGLELRTLLCEIKHRGAFEHAYVGFTHLVSAVWKCPLEHLNTLPQEWLEEILNEIRQPVESQKMKFCSSRRSAGLPFLVQAIISTELRYTNSARVNSFEYTMDSLLTVAEAEEGSVTLEAKIHSLNILRALYKHAQLGEYVASYVSRGLMVAIQGSRAAAWSIRNSSSLLFSALVIRIFGVGRSKDSLIRKNRMTIRHFFQRYPDMFDFFLNEMKLAFQDSEGCQFYHPQPHVFHILMILGRLYPSPNEDSSRIDFSQFFPFINTSCHNATLKIRELGAKALAPLICPDNIIEELETRFTFLKSDGIDNNYKHGILLQVKTILLEMREKAESVKETIAKRGQKWIEDTESILYIDKKSTPYLIKMCYIQILHKLFKVSPSLGKQINELLKKKDLLGYYNHSNEIEKNIPGRFVFLESLYFLRFDVAVYMWLECGNSDDLTRSFMSMLESEVDEVQAVALRILQSITSEEKEETESEEDFNLITMKLNDLYCINNENRFKVLKLEILSQSAVLQYVTQSFLSLLINAKNSSYLHNTITKLKITVISNFLLQNLISVHDIYDLYKSRQEISGSIPDLLWDIVGSGSTAISVGAFICYSVYFFENLKDNIDFVSNSILQFTRLLFCFSDQEASIKQRKAACEIFHKYYYYFNHDLFKKDNQAMSIWMLPLRLISDEDPDIRNRVMELVPKYRKYLTENNGCKNLPGEFDDVYLSQLTTIPFKAQENLLECYIRLLDPEDLIHLIVQMVAFIVSAYINTINYEHTSKQNEDGVFEKSNPNPFCEELTFGRLLCDKLEELKNSVDIKSLFMKKLDSTHIANLKDFFPSLILPHFPETLNDFCIQIVNILEEEGLDNDAKIMSCSPTYVSELIKVFEV